MNFHRIVVVVLCVLMTSCISKWTNRNIADDLEDLDLETREDERGLVVLLPDVFFEYGKFELSKDAQDKIERISELLNDEKAVERKILVEGHTDSHGSEEYNLELSRKRAEAVKSELMFGNVRPDRIETQWAGESKPMAANENPDGSDNPEGRQLNRRVEVVILNP
ncbi:MAG: OmpA family protein [Gammaproteobacteria bacterium]|nr:OmpA family protein [Gammaproteobacteria bacterium]